MDSRRLPQPHRTSRSLPKPTATAGVRGLLALAVALAVAAACSGSFTTAARGSGASPQRLSAVPIAAAQSVSPQARAHARRLTDEVEALVAALKTPSRNRVKLTRALVAASRARQRALVGLLAKHDPAGVPSLILPRRARPTLSRVRGAAVEHSVEL